MKNKKFYSKGLQFECIGCGQCCTGAPGFVYLSETDIVNISEYLGIDKISFIKKYTIHIKVFGEHRLSLREKSNYDCIFYREKRCMIYPVRPYQCRSFPFWEKYMSSEYEWEKLKNDCPGVGIGRVYSAEEIEDFLKSVPNYNIFTFKVLKDVEI